MTCKSQNQMFLLQIFQRGKWPAAVQTYKFTNTQWKLQRCMTSMNKIVYFMEKLRISNKQKLTKQKIWLDCFKYTPDKQKMYDETDSFFCFFLSSSLFNFIIIVCLFDCYFFCMSFYKFLFLIKILGTFSWIIRIFHTITA